MAKVRDNLFVRGLSGKLGNQFVIRHLRDGQTIVCVRPDFSHRKLSKEQKKHHQRFKAASAYARAAAQQHPIYATLAKGTIKNAYNVALGDWFHPPVIESVKKTGKTLRMVVKDDVCVAGVQVLIYDEAGKVIETGDAVKGKGDVWQYLSTAEGRPIVEAWDLPGNRVTKEVS